MQQIVYVVADSYNRKLKVGLTSNGLKMRPELEDTPQPHASIKLVYFEVHDSEFDAQSRSDQLKNWRPSKMQELIDNANYLWRDLSHDLSLHSEHFSEHISQA